MLQQIGQTDLYSSKIALGCMRMAGLDEERVDAVLSKSLELGINFFDHADIYAKGESSTKSAT